MNKNGFTLVELLIAIGLTALFLPAMVFVFSFSLGAASQGESYTQAQALAQENMEAIYYLKENAESEWGWEDNNPVNTTDDQYYQPEKTDGTWSLGTITTDPQEVNGYTSTVKILTVDRKTDGNIVEDDSQISDPTTRKIVVTVSWKEKGQLTKIDLVSYVTKH